MRVSGYLVCSFPKIPEEAYPYNCYLKYSPQPRSVDGLIGVEWKEVNWSLDDKKVTVVGVVRTGYWMRFTGFQRLTFYVEARTIEPYS